ncbi:MAG TPA: serine hydrolase [Draconibacterium sp.]|nr:serine hydrolase [Draconibacterium sp.]
MNKLGILILFFTFLFQSCKKNETVSTDLPQSTPEAEGVSSQSIIDFLNTVENSQNELQSFMFVRHGKVIAEGWWDPYKPELKHTLYSLSKSFTSTAIGFAVGENLLSVNDKVISFFPDELPDMISNNLAKLEVRHLLTMSVGQDPEPTFSIISTYNWVKEFLATPIVHEPGTKFLYNTAATYMLAAIIHKVTGENVVDYLQPRLFEPLAITGADWEIDPKEVNTGGWGLRLKTEDLAKFGQLYLQNGVWNGKQVLPEGWAKEATTKKIDQNPDATPEELAENDWLQGYGYKFWRSRHNSFRGDGAYGQYVLVFPEEDAVIAITAETQNMQNELDLVFDNLLPGMKERKLDEDKTTLKQLQQKLTSLKLSPPNVKDISVAENKFNGKTFVFEEMKPAKVLFKLENGTLEATLSSENGNVETLNFGAGKWILGETNIPVTSLLPLPNDNFLKLAPFKVAGAFSCPDENSMELTLRYIESPHTEYYLFKTDGDKVSLERSNSRTNRMDKTVFEGTIQQ